MDQTLAASGATQSPSRNDSVGAAADLAPGGGERRRQPNFRRREIGGHHLASEIFLRIMGSNESFRT